MVQRQRVVESPVASITKVWMESSALETVQRMEKFGKDQTQQKWREREFQFHFSSVQSLSRVRSLRPHESQHARPPVHHHLLEFTQTRPLSP